MDHINGLYLTITVTSHWPPWRLKSSTLGCLFNHLLKLTTKKTSKHALLALCDGNSPVTGEFPAVRASNAEKSFHCIYTFIRLGSWRCTCLFAWFAINKLNRKTWKQDSCTSITRPIYHSICYSFIVCFLFICLFICAGMDHVGYIHCGGCLRCSSGRVLCGSTPALSDRATGHRIDSYGGELHYCGVIMGAMVSQITGVSIVDWNVCSGADQRYYQSSASLAFVRGIHRWPVNSPHKGPVTCKMFHLMTSSWADSE